MKTIFNLFNLAFFTIYIFSSAAIFPHKDDGYFHGTQSLPQKIWMKNLPDYRKVNKISIPGTHDSAALYGGEITQTQSLNIGQQLNAGIRFLDIRVVYEKEKLNIYHGIIFQKQDLDQALSSINNFLIENPKESVFMRISAVKTEQALQENFNNKLLEYITKYKKIIFKPSHQNKLLLTCNIRGKILLYRTETGTVLSQYAYDYHNKFITQDKYNMKTNWDLHSKWEKVRDHINQSNIGTNQSDKAYLNYLSASVGSFPYFVASGHLWFQTSAPRLITGLTTPGFKNRFPDFPRVNCFLGICSIVFEGVNTLVKKYLQKEKNNLKYVGILAADFPGSGLIDSIININSFSYQDSLEDNKNNLLKCKPAQQSR